ncbi:helix-turn-helix transcriptional regulator [Saccharopolyspora sp. WRP15-2]|uniref:Helix-turn-helix transcriptional regulator n=1 Tax=Saccharopolyspora oryzae TaxID=2997343 RepID=A0ABT4UT58_9PSEU|nr:helix-turn-helix transcriptional regulator [Saccharopolyspora oryzae]MDA3624907.1 helix-turn-helix transcriptional regulator [Saccharopolyspora oryzae]
MAGNTRTPKARALGAALRAAREDQGLGLRQLAKQIECPPGTLSRWETGDRCPKPADIARVLTTLGVTGEKYEEILAMTEGANDPHWLAVSLPEQRQQLSALLEFERTARTITHAAPLLIPGLLQSTAYVRAIMTAGGVPPEEVETRIAVRVGRREAITRNDKPVQLKAAIGEAALRQVVGGRDAMTDQLGHLLDLSELDNIEVRVVPFESGWHPALEGLFVLIESDEAPPAVHLENRRSGLFLHEPADIDIYREAAETVFKAALDAAQSKQHIAKVRKETEAAR